VDLVRTYPEITIVDIDALLTQVRGVMDRAALAVQYVFAFTLLAGLVVLLAAAQATRDERRFESAILRTLGASRNLVLKGVAAEFLVLGLLAGVLAAAGASVAGYFLAREIFNLAYTPDPAVWVAGIAGGALLVGFAGVLAAWSAVTQPPVATLRQAQA
jgi:putative ABC transport system permease protein